jgi:1-phosphofructokinase family hexose kinase
MIYTITLNPALDREMTVSNILLNQVLRASEVRIDIGGKGFNVSRALLALGMESIAIGFIGGTVGEQLASGLAGLGINTELIRISSETRTNLSVVDEQHQNHLKINESGPQVSQAEAEAMLKKISELARKNDWWILSGSTPPGIPEGYVSEIVRRIRIANAFAVVDMDGECLQEACKAGALLVKPNAPEASELAGIEISSMATAVAALKSIHRLGARQVAISLGKVGAVYYDGVATWCAIPPAICERNPIGAGDAMLAGMVYGLQRQLTEDNILRWGVACGAAVASLDGTAVGTLEQVSALSPLVQVFLYPNKPGLSHKGMEL